LRDTDSHWTEDSRSPTLCQALTLSFFRSQLIGVGQSSSLDLFEQRMNDRDNASDGKSSNDSLDDQHNGTLPAAVKKPIDDTTSFYLTAFRQRVSCSRSA
jgi:hypothetical protein